MNSLFLGAGLILSTLIFQLKLNIKLLNNLSNLENVSVDLNSSIKGKSAMSVFCDNYNAKVALDAALLWLRMRWGSLLLVSLSRWEMVLGVRPANFKFSILNFELILSGNGGGFFYSGFDLQFIDKVNGLL